MNFVDASPGVLTRTSTVRIVSTHSAIASAPRSPGRPRAGDRRVRPIGLTEGALKTFPCGRGKVVRRDGMVVVSSQPSGLWAAVGSASGALRHGASSLALRRAPPDDDSMHFSHRFLVKKFACALRAQRRQTSYVPAVEL